MGQHSANSCALTSVAALTSSIAMVRAVIVTIKCNAKQSIQNFEIFLHEYGVHCAKLIA